MAQKPLVYKQIQHAAKHYNAHNGVLKAAADAAGMAESTFRRRVNYGKQSHPNLFKTFEASLGGPPRAVPARTLGEDVRLHRAEQDAGLAKARLKEALAQMALLEDRLKDLEWANNVSFKPANWTFTQHENRKREHIPELFTSDLQVGEVSRASETESGYDYSPEIFVKRYRNMIDTVNYLAHHHGGSGWTYPGIIYLRGGDTVDGSIHPEDNGASTMTPIEAVELVAEEESRGVELLADAFGKVEVKTPGGAGNHDRINKKPVSKKAFANSYDRLIHKMLVTHFRKDKRVTFQTSESFDVRYKIYDQNILLTHGDRMSGGGGTGFIGPIANIIKGWQKVMQEQALLGYTVNQMRNGHFHTPFWSPRGWSNGCMPGYTEFAKSFRMQPTPPMQLFGFHHRKRGLVDMKPLMLVE